MEIKDLMKKNYTKYSFGEFVSKRRKELGLSLKELGCKLNVSSPYLTDIEKGRRKAPRLHMKELVKYLQISPSEIDDFYDRAFATQGYFYEFEEYLESSPYARMALRLAKDKNFSNEQWEKIINQMLEDDH